MRCKIISLNLKAGRPIVFINESDAAKLSIHPGERAEIKYKKSNLIAIADIVKDLVKPGSIALSQDIISSLHAKSGDIADINFFSHPKSSKIIQRLVCKPYSQSELNSIISDVVSNSLSEVEIAHFVSGVFHCDMSDQEVFYLTKAMVKTGDKLSWNHKLVADKHSIGGIPGNRTTPIIVSICAAAGVIMPKTSSRAITSAAGTADVVETLARVDFSARELKSIVEKTGACLAWGGSLGLAPADDKLIQVEKMLNIDPEPQLLASILAKKVAVGSKYVLIDIPAGPGAKVSISKAKELNNRFKRIASKLGLKLTVVVTDGSQPIGNGIGPVLEIIDVLKVLERQKSPIDLEKKSVFLAGKILEISGKAKKGKGKIEALKILNSGAAFNKFKEIISAQGGDVNKELPKAEYRANFLAEKTGKISRIDNLSINYVARVAGCPLDKAAGIYLYKHKGDHVKKGEVLFTIHAESKIKFDESREMCRQLKPILVKS
jgi:AMP phosphorylase